MTLCKRKRIKEYWNAVGSSKRGFFRRKDLLLFLIIGAIPIIGQLMILVLSIFASITARNKKRVPKEYRLDYIEKKIWGN